MQPHETDLDLLNDPNFLAYTCAIENHEFNDLGPVWVAFGGGKLVATEDSREMLLAKIGELGLADVLIKQVNVPEEVIRLPAAPHTGGVPRLPRGVKPAAD